MLRTGLAHKEPQRTEGAREWQREYARQQSNGKPRGIAHLPHQTGERDE